MVVSKGRTSDWLIHSWTAVFLQHQFIQVGPDGVPVAKFRFQPQTPHTAFPDDA